MLIAGLDFTSNPTNSKKNIIITSQILDNKILVRKLLHFSDFESLIEFFSKSSPILCGCDFPFNFPLDYQKEFGLKNFNDTKKLIAKFNKNEFKNSLRKIQKHREYGFKYSYRLTDKENFASSPVNVINPPTGLMLYEGLKMFSSLDCCVYPFEKMNLKKNNFFETYPKIFLKLNNFTEKYKDEKHNNSDQLYVRKKYISFIKKVIRKKMQLEISMPSHIEQECLLDYKGDVLDAFICMTITLNLYYNNLYKYPVSKVYKKEGFIFNGLES